MTETGRRQGPSGATALACVLIWLGFSVALFTFGPYGELTRLSGGPLLEEQFDGYGADALWVRLEELKPAGRALYEQFQVLDGANAILMAIGLSLALSYLLTRLTGRPGLARAFAALPILAGGLELAENALLIDALRAFPDEGRFPSQTGLVTQIKLAAGFSTLALAAAGVAGLLVKTAVQRFGGRAA